MSLTADQINAAALAALTTYTDAASRAATLNATQETALVDLLDKWDAVKDKYSYLNGKIAGYVTETGKKRIAIRNDVRGILGLPRNAAELESVSIGSNTAAPVSSSNSVSTFEF